MSTMAVALERKEKAAAHRVEMCSVRLGEALFGIPITHILEIIGSARPQPVPLAPSFVGGLVHYRGDVLTTVSLRQLLSMPPREGAQSILVSRVPADASACSSTGSARSSPSLRPTTSRTPRFSMSAAEPCLPAHTN